MLDLTKYSFANAKIRAMLSGLIEPKLFSRLYQARDIYEIIELLKTTLYAEAIRTAQKEKINLQQIEKAFLRLDLGIHRKVYDIQPLPKEKYFIFLLTGRYETEELKVVLRLWHKKIKINLEDYIIDNKINYEIDFRRVISSQNIEELIACLDNTPYGGALAKATEKFKKYNSLFYLESALDIDYYQRLALATQGLAARDRKIVHKILGAEIDIENINWLLRLQKYYSLDTSAAMGLLISGGKLIDKKILAKANAAGGVNKIIESLSGGPYTKIKELFEQNVYLLEQFLYEILVKEIKMALAGFPFTIGIPLGYLMLKRQETKSIVSLLYAKSLGLESEEAEHLINI